MSYLYGINPKNEIKAISAKGKYLYFKNKKCLDLSFASGSLILGHTSKVFKNSLKKIEKIGSNYSLINTYVEKFSVLLKKIFPDFSKFIMCATGSEANMKALRIARAITKKNKIVMISGSWHGSVDELLYSSNDTKSKFQKKLSNGLINNKNTILIPYNNIEESKKILNKQKKDIAILIIEPIQQSLPLIKSEKYIKQIFKYCKKNNILICFDEMITGLRLPEFSVFKKLKIVPDILTFGKIFGGGVPIGIIGLTKKIEKALNKNTVFFGGTYSFNPLSSFLGLNTVSFILKNRIKIYKKLEDLSKYLTSSLNEFTEKNNIDVKLIRYASVIRIIFTKKSLQNKIQKDQEEFKKIKKINKFKKFAFQKKIHLSKNGAIFLSYENSKKDMDYILKIFKYGFKKFLA
jgi:glutamate-1-semialdehyde 2,1-aminomutase